MFGRATIRLGIGPHSSLCCFGRPFVKRFTFLLSDSCRSVLSVCLSVATLVYCGQTVGWIKMEFGMRVGLGSGHIVLDGEPVSPPLKGYSPQFSAHICCGQMSGWINMPLGMQVGLAPGNYFVLDGDPAPSRKSGHSSPIFGPYVYCVQPPVVHTAISPQ